MSEKKMIQITGLWLNESDSGAKYMVGYMGNARVLIFRNSYKEEEKHPDYIMYLAENEKKAKVDDDVAF